MSSPPVPQEIELEQTVVAPSGQHHATVIFLHGLGQTAQSWIPMVQTLAEHFPNVKWILPQSLSISVTMNNGQIRPAWFDVFHLPPCRNCSTPGSHESLTGIERIIQEEARISVEPNKIILAGFSQGAALSMLLSLTSLHDLGGVASFSGWIPHRCRQQITDYEPCVPVFWGHGTADTEVTHAIGEECIDFLRHGLEFPEDKITFKSYEGLEHAVSEQEIQDFIIWLSHILH